MPLNNAATFGLAIALSFGAVACGGDDGGETAASVEYSSDLLALDASVVGGGEYSLEQHADSDLVLWFWAPW